jgi:hypothetical protein
MRLDIGCRNWETLPLEKSINAVSEEKSESVKISINPKEDGFYQLGYRQAISDVLYYLSLLVLGKILYDLVTRDGE